MSKGFAVVLITLALVAPAPASAVTWSLGTHLGLSTIRFESGGGDNATTLAWPNSTVSFQPGLRVGIGDAEHANELLLDSGLFTLGQSGSSFTLFAGSASYQHTFGGASPTAAFVNAGVGLYYEGGSFAGSTSTTIGAGLGVRHVVNKDHGAVRAEVRLDRIGSDDQAGRSALDSIGLRLGFDLWL